MVAATVNIQYQQEQKVEIHSRLGLGTTAWMGTNRIISSGRVVTGTHGNIIHVKDDKKEHRDGSRGIRLWRGRRQCEEQDNKGMM